MNEKTFSERWKEANEFFQSDMPEMAGVGASLRASMQKQYTIAGKPYGDTEDGMLKWIGEEHDRNKKRRASKKA